MKIITINTHSLEEPDYERKLHQFTRVVLAEKPDILAMQEVNQSVSAEELSGLKLSGYTICPDFSGQIRQDNHAAKLAEILSKAGCHYFWTWVPAKIGYGIYEEGLSLFSRSPIEQAEQLFISRNQDFSNWRTRKSLGIKTRGESGI